MTKKWLALLAAALLMLPLGARAQVEQHPLLDEALALLEPDNIFIRRYNQLTGSEIEAAFYLGVPYHFGGQFKSHLYASYPEYRQMYPWAGGQGTQSADKLYIMGLDCVGFMNLVFEEAGFGPVGKISSMMLEKEYQQHYLYSSEKENYAPDDWEELAKLLQLGDILIANHPARHVMIYIGTLSDFGFVPGEYPELDNYLQYPLVIHAADNPQVRDRFANLIKTNKRYGGAEIPCGGVAVSILGIPIEAAPKLGNIGATPFHGYVIDEGKTHLYIWDFAVVDSYMWYRPPALSAQ